MSAYKHISKPVRKKDAMSLLLGKPAYVEDVTPDDCLIVKVLRSPYAHALIEDIDVSIASKVPEIEAIYTYRDVPQKRRFLHLLKMGKKLLSSKIHMPIS